MFGSVKVFMKNEVDKRKPHPALAVPLVNAGRRQSALRNTLGKIRAR